MRYVLRLMMAPTARRRHTPRRAAAALVLLTAALTSPRAQADIQHVVARGHTIDAIAHRYHVTVAAIVEANHLKDPKHLKIGETLVIPGVSAGKPGATKAGALVGKNGKPLTYAMRAKTPGVVHATRLTTN